MSSRSWLLSEGITAVRAVEALLRPLGFFTALTGSVLYKGSSAKDLDIVVVPLDASKPLDLLPVWEALSSLGWKQTHSARDIKEIWRDKGSSDTKHVEAWRTTDRRRVDIMVLK